MVFRLEMTFEYPEPHHCQHESTEGYVESMEAGQQKEGGAVDTGVQRQAEFTLGFGVFLGLQEQEHDAEQYRQAQPDCQLLAVLVLQRGMRDVHGNR